MTKTYEMPFTSNENENKLKNGIKRVSKPQLEKMRRARINTSLDELKKIVVDSRKLNIKKSKAKLEKADILEYTVRYVKELHQFNQFSDRKENTGADQNQLFTDYMTGFAECAKRVEEFFCNNPPNDPIVVTSLSTNLKNCIRNLEPQNSINYGVIRHTNQCCPPSPALSTISSVTGSATNTLSDMDMSSTDSIDENTPLNLSSNVDHFDHQFINDKECVWRPW